MSARILSIDQLPPFRDTITLSQQTLVLANGAFDLFHVGHLRYLQGAKAQGDVLVVAINSDASVRQSKGPDRPWVPEAERLEIVLGLQVVDYAFLFNDKTLHDLIRILKPHVHAKGTDYTPDSVPEAPITAAMGGRTVIVGDPKNHSSSATIQKLSKK